MIRAVVCTHDHLETIGDPARISDWLTHPEATVWLDIADPHAEDLHWLREEFVFHALTLEDVTRRHQRPKIDVYPDYYFLVVYALHPMDGDEAVLALDELAIFLGSNYIVTVHARPIHEVNEVWERWRQQTDIVGTDVGSLLYVLLDRIIDDYFPVVDQLAERVEDIEEKIFEAFDRTALADIFTLKKDLLALRRVVAPERDVLNVLLRRDPPILPPHAVIFFQDVYDHTLRVLDSIDTYRDLISSALDAYLSVQSNNLNEVMRRLTVISTIFLPLTFLTGFFGMNFEALPFKSALAMWASLAVMLLTPPAMLWYFRWKGWR